MLLHVFSDTGQYLGRINSFISVSWTEEYIGKGKLAMYCYDTDETAKLLRHGYLLYRADRGTAMEIVRIDRDDQTRQIYVGGYTTLNPLSRRVVTEAYDANVGESSIYGLLSANLRGLPVANATAKGYTDCVAFMGEDGVSVVVSTASGELTGEDVARITDIAMKETGYDAAGIRIMAAN